MAIKKGDLILKSEPFAYVLCSEFRGLYCDCCLKKHEELHRCTQCLFTYYCDKKCQKIAWKDHKQECLNLKKVNPAHPTDFVRLMARIIYKLKIQPDTYEKVGNATRHFHDLLSHTELLKNDALRMNQYNVISKLVKDFITQDVIPSDDKLLEIFGKITINSYSICDIEMQMIGVGLYLGASIFDHSCQPTATIVFKGPTLILNAVENISQLSTSEVYISYLELLATTEERRRDLKSQYYFDCTCVKCKDVEKDLLTNSLLCTNTHCSEPAVIKNDHLICIKCGELEFDKNKMKDIQDLTENCKKNYEEMNQLQKSNNYQEIYDKANDCIEKTKSVFHLLNVHFVRIVDFAFDSCINLSKWEIACDLGEQVLVSYRYYYGDFNPNLSVHLLKLGKIQLYLENLPKAKELLTEAENVIIITHTRQHKLYSICRDLLSQCEIELKLNHSLSINE